MTPELLAAMQAHAAEEFPREACGVVIEEAGAAKYWPCVNIATDLEIMVAAPRSLIAAEDAGRLLGYAHSHAQGPPSPTFLDIKFCNRSELPWWIVQAHGDQWSRLNPIGRKLVERQYVFGVDDCWSVCREWYNTVMELDLPDFVRSFGFWTEGFEPHVHHMKDASLEEVSKDDVRRGDLLLFKLGAATISHCGVVIGDGTMLHHMETSLSRYEQLNDKWAKRIAKVVRHI